MCGIGAILDPAGVSGARPPRGMVAAFAIAAPTATRSRCLGPATLASTRLAIIDVAGRFQPLDSEDGAVTAVVNGEIYNHRELRARLERRGHRFATGSDCEVVVHGYEEHGTAVVRELNGIFAFALWDARARQLVAARDHFGVKPLYWWSDGRRLALASEIGALIAAGLVEPHSIRGARPLPGLPLRAGTARCSPASGKHLHRRRCSWPPRRRAARGELPRAAGRALPRGGRPRRLAEALTERFEDAVQRQMMSDVPYGARSCRGGSTRRRSWPPWRGARRAGRPRSRSGSPVTARCWTSVSTRRRAPG